MKKLFKSTVAIAVFSAGMSTAMADKAIENTLKVIADVPYTDFKVEAIGWDWSQEQRMDVAADNTLEELNLNLRFLAPSGTEIHASILGEAQLIHDNTQIPLTVTIADTPLKNTPEAVTPVFSDESIMDIMSVAPTDPDTPLTEGAYRGDIALYFETVTPNP